MRFNFNDYKIFYIIGASIITPILLFMLIPPFNDWSFVTDSELYARYGDFVGGLFGSLLTGATILLLIYYNNKQLYLLEKQQIKFEEVSNKQIDLLKEEINENKISNKNNLKLLEEELNNTTFFYVEDRLEKSISNLIDFRKKNIIIQFKCFHQPTNRYKEFKINCNSIAEILNFLNDYYENIEKNSDSNFEEVIFNNFFNYYMNIIVEIMNLSDISFKTNKFSKYYNIYNKVDLDLLNRDRFYIIYFYIIHYKNNQNIDKNKIKEHFNSLNKFGIYKYFEDSQTKENFLHLNNFLKKELKKYDIDIIL